MSSRWQAVKAHREQRQVRAEVASNAALEAIRGRSYNGLGLPALPAVGPMVAPVRVLNADGSLREVIPAEAFRRRREPAEEAQRKVRQKRRPGTDPVVWRKRAENPGWEVGDVPEV